MPSDIPFVGAYFVHCPLNGLVKVGFTSRSPDQRLAELQQASPVELVPLGVIPGPFAIESILHREFAACRHHLEWFKPNMRMKDFLISGIDPWPSRPIDPEQKRFIPRWVEDLRSSIDVEARHADIVRPSYRSSLPIYTRNHLKRPKSRPE